MIEPLLEFLRTVECYNARRNSDVKKAFEINVFLMLYPDSMEKFHNMQAIEQEKKAFSNLIASKAKLYVDLKPLNEEVKEVVVDSRKGNKKQEEKVKDIIIVDTREFSCTTPVYLHEAGYWIYPMQLVVGDYILSNEICVERKSVVTGDLVSSF